MRFQIRWSRVSTNNVLDFLQPEEGRQYSMFLCTVDSISDAVHDKCLTGMSAHEHPVLCPRCCNLPVVIHRSQQKAKQGRLLGLLFDQISDKVAVYLHDLRRAANRLARDPICIIAGQICPMNQARRFGSSGVLRRLFFFSFVSSHCFLVKGKTVKTWNLTHTTITEYTPIYEVMNGMVNRSI